MVSSIASNEKIINTFLAPTVFFGAAWLARSSRFSSYFPGATKAGLFYAPLLSSAGVIATQWTNLSTEKKRAFLILSLGCGALLIQYKTQEKRTWSTTTRYAVYQVVAWAAARYFISIYQPSYDHDQTKDSLSRNPMANHLENYDEQLQDDSLSSDSFRQHFQKFKRLERLLDEFPDPDDFFDHLGGLDGYVHASSEWSSNKTGLSANIRSGIDTLRASVQKFSVQEISSLFPPSNPCFHGVIDVIQSKLMGEQFEQIVNVDPKHTPEQRIAELVRVYQHVKFEEWSLSEDPDTFDENCMKEALVLSWCLENKYIGRDSSSVTRQYSRGLILEKGTVENWSNFLK